MRGVFGLRGGEVEGLDEGWDDAVFGEVLFGGGVGGEEGGGVDAVGEGGGDDDAAAGVEME